MRRLLSLLILAPTSLWAGLDIDENLSVPTKPYEPWFTGTFLSPTSVNMEVGHPMIQPSVTVFNTYGRYDSDWKIKKEKTTWTITPAIDLQFAFSQRTGFEITVGTETNIRDRKSSTHFLDTSLYFGYQVSNEEKDSWVPNFRLLFQTILPTGKYDHFDPKKNEIDQTGQGAYFFGLNFNFSKLFRLPNHFLTLDWSIVYLFPTEAHVKGFNNYGGGFGTNGSIRPGQILNVIFSVEYSLNQRLVLALDTSFFYQAHTSHFKGKVGVLENGLPGKVGLPSSVIFSLAPQIEYSFSAKSGLIFGTWWTIAGRNTHAFGSGFLNYLYIF